MIYFIKLNNFNKFKNHFYLVCNHFLPNPSILRQALVKPSFTCYSKVDTSKLQTLWIALYFQQIYIGTHVMKFKDPNADIN